MIYALVYPEKFEGDKGVKLMQVFATPFQVIHNIFKLSFCVVIRITVRCVLQLAKLSTDDMKVIQNMQLLAGSSTNKNSNASSKGAFSLKFDAKKVIKNLRPR